MAPSRVSRRCLFPGAIGRVGGELVTQDAVLESRKQERENAPERMWCRDRHHVCTERVFRAVKREPRRELETPSARTSFLAAW